MMFLLFLLLILVLLAAFFSCAEMSLMALNPYKLRILAKKNDKKAQRVHFLLSKPEKILSGIIIGRTTATIGATVIVAHIGNILYGKPGAISLMVGFIMIMVLFGEMLPKTIGALYSQPIAFKISILLSIYQKILSMLIYFVNWFTQILLYSVGIALNPSQKDLVIGEAVRSVAHEASGLLPIERKNMLLGLLDLDQAVIEDIMTPIADIFGLDLNQPWHQVLDQLENASQMYIPIYKDSLENLLGIVHLRNVLHLALEENLNKETLLEVIEEPYFIPQGTSLNQQLANFKKIKRRTCFVVNEYGDIQGLVTLEDLLEEVIGEFAPDYSDLSKDIMQQDDNTFIVDASITLRNLKRLLGWRLPQLGPRTLSGLIIEYLGCIPPADCCLSIQEFQIEILKVGDNMVKTVKMRKSVKL